jgi:hypothetical protein
MIRPLRLLAALLTVILFVCHAQAAKGPAYTDPNDADADFAVQGEYEGEVKTDEGQHKVGLQMIALGQGKFRAVGYPGGLPGAGWNQEEKIQAEGEIVDGVATFECEKGKATYKDGVVTVASPDGNATGTLKKVMRDSPTLDQKPPAGAIVLFDGTSVDGWHGRMTEDGLLMQGAVSKENLQSHQLHLEFCLPYMPEARGQGRGNSGLYVVGRYEIQMLDSFGLEGKDNECGGIYKVAGPAVNMCLPPLSWQTYDVEFTAPKYDDAGNKTANARITLKHNGVVIHDNIELPHPTPGGKGGEESEPGPVYLQDHGNPVRYRNIWAVPK